MSLISKELTRLYNRDGALKPSVVVKEARKQTSPLHDKFQWDDTKAAGQYRLEQARSLIRVTKIEYKGQQTQVLHVPVVKTVTGTKEGEYKPIPVIVRSQSERQRCLSELTNQITAMMHTVDALINCTSKPASARSVQKKLHAIQAAIASL